MPFYNLSNEYFSIEGNNMTVNIGGLSLVFFHSKNQELSRRFFDQYRRIQLPESVSCGFYILEENEPQWRNLLLSDDVKNSTTPIDSVPKLVLYINGIPRAQYTSKEYTAQSINNFVKGVMNDLNRPRPPQNAPPPRSRMGGSGGNQQVPQHQPQNPYRPQQPPYQQQGGGGANPMAARMANAQDGGLENESPSLYDGKKHTINALGVKEFEDSYGIPFNAKDEDGFVNYDSAYTPSK